MGSKIMAGSPGVLALLDGDRYPFADKPPVAVRSMLYHWDFTRIDTPWAAAPSEALLNASQVAAGQGAWWYRRKVAEYAPALQLNNPSVKEFLGQFGWKEELLLPERQDQCTYSGRVPPDPTPEELEAAELLLPARSVDDPRASPGSLPRPAASPLSSLARPLSH